MNGWTKWHVHRETDGERKASTGVTTPRKWHQSKWVSPSQLIKIHQNGNQSSTAVEKNKTLVWIKRNNWKIKSHRDTALYIQRKKMSLCWHMEEESRVGASFDSVDVWNLLKYTAPLILKHSGNKILREEI